MKSIVLSPDALIHLDEWKKYNPEILKRIISLLTDIASTPYQGIGKPEPLKHQLKGKWSRRVTEEHRLIYEIKNDAIIIVSRKYHYE